jgi:hypothetical protein
MNDRMDQEVGAASSRARISWARAGTAGAGPYDMRITTIHELRTSSKT